MNMRIVMAAAALASLSACGPATSGIPEQDKQAVLAGCKSTGAPAQLCECTIKKIEASFTYAEFKDLNTAIEQRRDHPLAARLQALTLECGQEFANSGGQ